MTLLSAALLLLTAMDGSTPPPAGAPIAEVRLSAACLGLGRDLKSMTPDLARSLRIRYPNPRGLVVGLVDPGSDAASKGIQPGDVVVSVNQQATTTIEEFATAISAARNARRNSVLVSVRRGNIPPTYYGLEIASCELRDR